MEVSLAASQLSLFAPVPRAVAQAAFRAIPRPPLVVVQRAIVSLPAPKPLTPKAAPGGAAEAGGHRWARAEGPHGAERGLAPCGAEAGRPPLVERIPTGLADLDRFLAGGLPRGEVVEVCGGPSSGKATLALGAALGVLADGGRAAWIDPGTGFSPLAALEAGAPAHRLVVVRTPDDAAACRAADILLGAAGAVDLVVVDLASRAGPREARVTRRYRQAERGGAALLFLSDRPEGAASLGALVGLRLTVRRRPDTPVLEVGVARYKRGPGGRAFAAPHHEPDRLRLDTTL